MKVLVVGHRNQTYTALVRVFGPFEDAEAEKKKNLMDDFLESAQKSGKYPHFTVHIADLDLPNADTKLNFPPDPFRDEKWILASC